MTDNPNQPVKVPPPYPPEKTEWEGSPETANPSQHLSRAMRWMAEAEQAAIRITNQGYEDTMDLQYVQTMSAMAQMHLDAAFAKRHMRPGRNLRP